MTPPSPKVLVIRHAPHEGLGSFADHLEAEGFSLEYADLFTGVPCPQDPKDYAAIISMGGPMAVYEQDRHPFLTQEIALIRRTLEDSVPFLGICLGAQLLAAAAGAAVFPGREKEIGWFPVWGSPEAKEDLLFRNFPKEFSGFHWHGDTFDMPQGAVLLASSHRTTHQAFRIGDAAWGVQFHPEVNQEIVTLWTQGLPEHEAAGIRSGLGRFSDETSRVSQALIQSFSQLSKQKSPLQSANSRS